MKCNTCISWSLLFCNPYGLPSAVCCYGWLSCMLCLFPSVFYACLIVNYSFSLGFHAGMFLFLGTLSWGRFWSASASCLVLYRTLGYTIPCIRTVPNLRPSIPFWTVALFILDPSFIWECILWDSSHWAGLGFISGFTSKQKLKASKVWMKSPDKRQLLLRQFLLISQVPRFHFHLDLWDSFFSANSKIWCSITIYLSSLSSSILVVSIKKQDHHSILSARNAGPT